MNHGIKKLLVTMSLVLCLFGTVFATKVNAEDANTGNEVVTYERKVRAYTAERVSKYLAEENSYPELEGYLFAGWYTDEKCDDTCYLGVNEPSGIMYALFVPKQVLGVEAQIKSVLTNDEVTEADEVTSLRFVTSVDSLNYREVGFYVTYEIGGQEYTAKSASKKVYEELYYVDSTEKDTKVTPQSLFCNLSKYFKAGTVLNVPKSLYETEFTVQPFWTTMEGDIVKGEKVVKSVDMGCTRNEVYVSSVTDAEGNPIAQDIPYYGTYEYPYASLDYAIGHVKDNGTVRVKDSLTVATTTGNKVEMTEHGKTVTITGYTEDDNAETLHFPSSTHEDTATNTELYIRDNITFTGLDMTFPEYVFVNGHTVVVESDVNLLNVATEGANNLSYIYGGGKTETVSSTCLKLYAGSYQYIYGGGHNENAHVTGNTNVVIGPGVNKDADTSSHDKTYLLYGGCRMGAVGGNTNVTVLKAEEGQTPAKFNYVYGGGGYSASTKETAKVGKTNVEFAGWAYSIYGGGRYGTTSDTSVVMTDGAVYQIFGGCENNSMEGNTDVQVLGGTVSRRVFGGCYNDYITEWEALLDSSVEAGWQSSNYVTGYTSVRIDQEATVNLSDSTEYGLVAVSRHETTSTKEYGTFIFNEGTFANLSRYIGSSYFSNMKAYHYLVQANTGGKVTSAGDCIYIQPSDENTTATVRLDSEMGSIVYYAEEAGYCPLPDLVDGTRQVYVSFSEDKQTDFATNTAAARIGNVYYAELDSAVKAAEKMENATIVGLNGTEELAAITIETTGQGTVKTDKLFCQPGEDVTLTVNPKEGYYCSSLSVTKDDGAVDLNETFALDTEEYTFTTVDAGEYVVNATFVKRVFNSPSADDAVTTWHVLRQNQKTEILANGGTKISGTIGAEGLDGTGNSTLRSYETYTDMDLTLTVKEAAVGTGTTILFDFGEGYILGLRVVDYNSDGNRELRVVSGSKQENNINKNNYFNVYDFGENENKAYTEGDGVKVRLVRYGTELFAYVNGNPAEETIDLVKLSTTCGGQVVAENTKMTVGIQLYKPASQTGVLIPFSITDTATMSAVNINETTNGTVTADRAHYFEGDTVTLTVTPDDGYYCRELNVTNSEGKVVSLLDGSTIIEEATTFEFKAEENIYEVSAIFAKKVFDTPAGSTNTEWGLLEQNQSIETLANGGTKISGEITVKSKTSSDDRLYLYEDSNYTDIDLTMTVKDDPASDDGNPETIFTFDFGKPSGTSRVFQLKVYTTDENVVVQSTNSSTYSGVVHTLNTAQVEDYQSSKGVELRIARVGSQFFLYLDGVECDVPMIELSEKDITSETKFNGINIRHKGDKGATVVLPFSIANVVTPVAVNINEITNGTVEKNKTNYLAGDTVTLTVTPDDGYYCRELNVTNSEGKVVSLLDGSTIIEEATTFEFKAEENIYEVSAIFAKKVFDTPAGSTNTEWGLLEQNQSIETLANGGTKISGKITVKSKTSSDDRLYLYEDSNYTDIDLTMTVKDDPASDDGNPETIFTFDFGKPSGTSRVFQLKVYTKDENVVVQSTQSSTYSGVVHTLNTAQVEDYQSSTGVELRIARVGTQIFMYIDGVECDVPMIDLSEKDIISTTKFSAINIRHKGDKGVTVTMPFSIANKVTPVSVEVKKNSNVVTTSNLPSNTQNIDLESNGTYDVTVTNSGMTTDAYYKITYVDHLANETQSVYTPAVAAGGSFEFTYQNGVFNADTESEIATTRWYDRIYSTKDVLTVEVLSEESTEDIIEANATIGRAPMKKPSSTYPITNCNEGAISTTGEIVQMANYVYSDPIVIEKAGTKLTFTDAKKTDSQAGSDVLVVSSWTQDENGDYVFDSEGTNIPGQYKPSKTMTFRKMTAAEAAEKGYDTFIERYKSDTIEYMYITSKPNEVIRFCYCAEEGVTSFPKIVQTYSGETGTAVEIALAADTDTWLNAQKTGDTYATYNALFAGKKISVIGDSYMAGSTISESGDTNDLWISMFANKYGMTLNNHGVNGSTVSNYAGSTYNPMVDRWATAFENDTPDIIIVEGGRNDYNYNVPMGEIGTTDKGTFKGAATYLISSLKEEYPNAIIIGLTCWEVGGNRNAAGYYCSDYGRALIEVCESLEIPYINAMQSDVMNVYMTSSNFMGRFCLRYDDVSHLNEKGMKLVLPIFEEKIYNICK